MSQGPKELNKKHPLCMSQGPKELNKKIRSSFLIQARIIYCKSTVTGLIKSVLKIMFTICSTQ
jgi:hypothetical protein